MYLSSFGMFRQCSVDCNLPVVDPSLDATELSDPAECKACPIKQLLPAYVVLLLPLRRTSIRSDRVPIRGAPLKYKESLFHSCAMPSPSTPVRGAAARRGPSGPLKLYLTLYNAAAAAAWGYVLLRVARHMGGADGLTGLKEWAGLQGTSETLLKRSRTAVDE